MAIKRYKIGTTIHFSCEVRDVADALVNPDGGVVITVNDQDGNAVVSAQTMTNDGVGLFSYDWTTVVATHPVGIYKVTCKATSGAKFGIEVDDSALELF